MAGETEKCRAICLWIRPWSRTSHVVSWLTPCGVVGTVVKGAVRPKSQFLGQYDLNYSCEIVYYARASQGLHALRECFPLDMREALRGDYRALLAAEHMRATCAELAPAGPDGAKWLDLLERSLDAEAKPGGLVEKLLHFELEALDLAGLKPDFSGYDRAAEWSEFGVESGRFRASADMAGETDGAGGPTGRRIRVPRQTARWLCGEGPEKNTEVLLDAARVIGVFYQFHLGSVSEARRTVLKVISKQKRQAT